MAVCSVLQGQLATKLGFSATQIWLFCGVMSTPVLYYTAKSFLRPSANADQGEKTID